MTTTEVISLFKTLVDGAGPRVYLTADLQGEIADAADWRNFGGGSEFKNGMLVCWIPLSDARELINRAEQKIADRVFSELSS